MSTLLTRTEFRNSVFSRDKKCVLCGGVGVDAHHILERRLWPDGGYYLDNGALVCEDCHMACERTDVSVADVRKAAGIKTVVLPPHLTDDTEYDKWGNPVLPNGTRLQGELFHEESVQKILANHLSLFTKWCKYPRTYHLPWSQGRSTDDKVASDLSSFHGQRVIVTEKMDGENTTMYSDHIHARSLETSSHPSRTWIRQFHASIAHDIPDGWRICGENLYAKHSIHYTQLPSYFLVFSVWDNQKCLSWDDTVEWCALLGLETVRVLYDGMYVEGAIKAITVPHGEGYVVRTADSFPYARFRHNVMKCVREDHIQTDQHWLRSELIKNQIRS